MFSELLCLYSLVVAVRFSDVWLFRRCSPDAESNPEGAVVDRRDWDSWREKKRFRVLMLCEVRGRAPSLTMTLL